MPAGLQGHLRSNNISEKIALLGWGSLLWDDSSEFDALHGDWQFDGPLLKIEFSRISDSRSGALTLVIDPQNGVPVRVAYCLSKRPNISDVIEDIRKREKTATRNIGYFCSTGKSRSSNQESLESISGWAGDRDLNGVVWTDLPSNFEEKAGKPFTVANAVAYLQTRNEEARAKAIDYFRRAPDFVRTPLRDAQS
ncbi:MAG TPA: hypothetical protein ENH11_05825 [Candidatus Acetothermia bacterium]|nr:hypothetical protein [Candidatus Acetothermia bacterium]